MDFPILIIWMSPLSFVGASGVFFFSFLFHFSIEKANRIASDGRFAASHLGLFCLPISHKKDARLIWVNSNNCFTAIPPPSGASDECRLAKEREQCFAVFLEAMSPQYRELKASFQHYCRYIYT